MGQLISEEIPLDGWCSCVPRDEWSSFSRSYGLQDDFGQVTRRPNRVTQCGIRECFRVYCQLESFFFYTGPLDQSTSDSRYRFGFMRTISIVREKRNDMMPTVIRTLVELSCSCLNGSSRMVTRMESARTDQLVVTRGPWFGASGLSQSGATVIKLGCHHEICGVLRVTPLGCRLQLDFDSSLTRNVFCSFLLFVVSLAGWLSAWKEKQQSISCAA